MSQYTAFLDANVLYPAPMRDVLMQLAVAKAFKAKWSAEVNREWIEALMRNEPLRNRASLVRTQNLMNQATRDSLVTGYEILIPSLKLPHMNDRHVLAAAIVGKCDVIVTQNLRHFPSDVLKLYDIEALHPDKFLNNLLALMPYSFCSTIQKVRTRLKNPPYTAKGYLTILRQQGLKTTATELENLKNFI